GLTKSGAGTLTISTATAQTFTGAVFINGGTYAFSGQGTNDPTFGFGSGAKNVTIRNGAILNPLTSSDPNSGTKNFFVGPGGATFNVASGVTFTLNDGSQLQSTA